MELLSYLRQIPDYPKKGIIFQDITTLLGNAEAYHAAVDAVAAHYKNSAINKVVCLEARGYMLGSAIAYAMHAAFVPIRKKGKLPYKTFTAEYSLEYGTDSVEIHEDALQTGDHVLIFDDMLATGGTARAALQLVQRCGVPATNIQLCFLMDIKDVDGAAKQELKQHGYFALI